MNLTRRNICTCFVVLALGLMTGCAVKQPLKPAIHLDSGLQVTNIDLLTMLPAIDARSDKSIDVALQKQLNTKAKPMLEKRGYEVLIIESDGTESQIITKDDLKSGDAEWIKQLGPSDANWVMVLALDDVATKLTFGSTGNAEVSGFLFDKQTGTLVWRDKGVGKAGQGGLIGMAMKGMMGDAAIGMAVYNLVTSVPVRSDALAKSD